MLTLPSKNKSWFRKARRPEMQPCQNAFVPKLTCLIALLLISGILYSGLALDAQTQRDKQAQPTDPKQGTKSTPGTESKKQATPNDAKTQTGSTQTTKPAATQNNSSQTNDSQANPEENAKTSTDSEANTNPDSTDQTASDKVEQAETNLPQEKPHPLLVRAEEHFFNKRYHIALKLLRRVLDDEPENVQAYLYAGDIYLIQHNYGLAEQHFQIARELSQNPYKEWFRLGQVRLLRKDADQALQAFEQSYKLKPDMHINLFYTGMVYYQLKHDKKATIQAWQSYRKLAPNDPQGPAIDKALATLQKPDFSFPLTNEGPCIQLGDAKETKQSYKPGQNEKPKENNQSEPLSEEDDL